MASRPKEPKASSRPHPRPEEPLSSETESSIPFPPALSALLHSGDYPSHQLLGRSGVVAQTTDIPLLSVPTPAEGPAGSATLPTSPRGTPRNPDPLPSTIGLEGRDPFSLWVHWQADAAGVPPGSALRVRLFAHSLEGPWMLEQPVSASGHRTIPVLYANTVYIASLGIVSESGAWQPIAVSMPIRTAPDAPTHAWTSVIAHFQGVETPGDAHSDPIGSHTLPRVEPPSLPNDVTASFLASWAEETLRGGLEANSSGSIATRIRQAEGERAQADEIAPGPMGRSDRIPMPTSLPVSASTPVVPPPPGFWFRINAELILHGSTEPGASITIGGHPVRLRDDGSFTFRFSLPNGTFDLPVQAVKADGSDRRSANVTVSRSTLERGDVAVHPIDPSLRPPVVESVR